jgi:hypothetical protein
MRGNNFIHPNFSSPDSSRDNVDAVWREFSTQFTSEAACRDSFYAAIKRVCSIKCRYCHGPKLIHQPGSRTIRCSKCKRETWLTAGTFFHRIRLFRPWLAAIWMLENGVVMSASRFHKLVGIAYSSAFNILKKLATVIQNCSDDAVPVASSALFREIVCRRSRQTPRGEHPRTEEETLEESVNHNQPQQGIDSIESLNLSAAERQIYELLSEEPLRSDLLGLRTGLSTGQISAALIMLEIKGLASYSFGHGYSRSDPQAKGRLSTCAAGDEDLDCVRKFVSFATSKFQGISRKYLQQYLSAYWCQIDRVRWGAGSLMLACLQSLPITEQEILDYVTPQLVNCHVYDSR